MVVSWLTPRPRARAPFYSHQPYREVEYWFRHEVSFWFFSVTIQFCSLTKCVGGVGKQIRCFKQTSNCKIWLGRKERFFLVFFFSFIFWALVLYWIKYVLASQWQSFEFQFKKNFQSFWNRPYLLVDFKFPNPLKTYLY